MAKLLVGASDFEVECLHRINNFDVLTGDLFDWDIVNVDLVTSNQIKQEIERAFKNRQPYGKVTCWGQRFFHEVNLQIGKI